MFMSASVWFDIAGSLAIIFVLTLVYGQVQRQFFARQQGKVLLGIAFGGVAWLQMHLPIEPMQGLIIDLRNIPLVLCGAFLGLRASLLCFAIAALTRIEIGGVGMFSGVLGMMIAISVGGLWAHVTKALPKRGLRHMFALSILASLHLLAAFVLPEAPRTWFLMNASIPIAFLNFVSITLAASLLNAEQSKISRENRMAASAAFDPDHGAMTKPAFEREIMLRVSAGTMATPAALLVINLRYADVLFSIIPNTWRDRVLGLVRLRLKDAFANADLVCSLGATGLVIPLDETQLSNKSAIQSAVAHLMRNEPFHLSESLTKLISVDTHVQLWPEGKSLETVLISARFKVLHKRKDRHPWTSPVEDAQKNTVRHTRVIAKKQEFLTRSTTEELFSKAAMMMKPREFNS